MGVFILRWVCTVSFTLIFFTWFSPFFFFVAGLSWVSMQFNSYISLLNLTVFPRFFLPPERASSDGYALSRSLLYFLLDFPPFSSLWQVFLGFPCDSTPTSLCWNWLFFHASFCLRSGLLYGAAAQNNFWSILLRGVSRDMHQSCFITGWTIYQMAWIIFLALYSAALLGAVWRSRFYPLSFTATTGMFVICPNGDDFRRCYSFVDLFHHLNEFKHYACIIVGITLKVIYL